MASADKAEAAQTEKNILIIEEQFFEEVPVASCEITGMGRVKADGGTSATLIRLAHPLPEAAMKYAISADSIPEATSLLEKAKTARVPNSLPPILMATRGATRMSTANRWC
jgi:hypothetical protein